MAYNVDRIAIDVDASGDATDYSQPIIGLLHALVYVPGTLDTGADLTVTDDVSGHALITVTNGGTSTVVLMPRGATVDTVNAASLYEPSTGEPVEDLLPIISRVKVVTAAGGVSTSGSLYVVWQD